MNSTVRYIAFKPRNVSYYCVILLCLLTMISGGYCAYMMEVSGHIITGMNNHVAWGLPHVFAVGLIVTASGVLNGATCASVLGMEVYKPVARLSVVLASSTLLGGLTVLVLDLGRPDRLLLAFTHHNFGSIFTWNIFLYTGLLLICVVYLWMMMEKRFNRQVTTIGLAALVWRIVLTSGTGAIFGLLTGKNIIDTALMAMLFVVLSLVLGTAALVLVTILLKHWQSTQVDDELQKAFNRMQLLFLLVLGIFSIVYHLINVYARQDLYVPLFTLTGGLTTMFSVVYVLTGLLVPLGITLYLLKKPGGIYKQIASSIMSLTGGFLLLYIVIIGSQNQAKILFPGKTVLASRFGDGGFPAYVPSVWEWGVGLGGVAFSFFIFLLLIRVFALIPESQPSTVSKLI